MERFLKHIECNTLCAISTNSKSTSAIFKEKIDTLLRSTLHGIQWVVQSIKKIITHKKLQKIGIPY